MFRITVIVLSILLAAQLHLKYQLPVLLLYFYAAINIFSFAVYAFDKSAARKGNWRIKEFHLHILSVFGGWWGALIAQQFIRHKSVKKPFLIVFIITLLTNLLLLFVFLYKGRI